ncbi:glycosyltransferase [Methylotenera sp.]|uniref:glycosyltransferase n=1 Tax=Methylotenera sp. TaxID=2051956 RepID=UPI002735872A|nr:glycosyltransferase [Methylotenera sp.]MDP3211526.1 glycosyltransferase [Methylotenera sp.]
MKIHDLKISVLLATYNGGNYLNEQLNSIQNQSNVEVLIVTSDDCSSDNSLQLLKGACTANSELIILSPKRLGSAAVNFFRLLRDTDFSQVDYVALSDQDDIWQSDKLSHALRKIQENNVDAYSSNVIAFWSSGSQKLINKAQPQQKYDYMFESAGPGCTYVLSKDVALDLQKFLIENEEKCHSIELHDWFIYAYARSNGYKWFIDPTPHMLYRQHADNVIGANVGLKAKLARWKKLRDGWLVEQALLIANILGYSNVLPIQKLIRYNFADRLWLILNVTKLRRRLRDRIALVLFLLMPLKR